MPKHSHAQTEQTTQDQNELVDALDLLTASLSQADAVVSLLVEKGEREGFEKGKAESGKSNSVNANLGKPTLIPAKVESRFVDDQVRGNVFVPAHVEYIIVEPARWTR